MNTAITVKLDRCGFCGARRNVSCREFGQNVADHSERFTTLPELFVEELDGITAPTMEQAYEWEWQAEQYRQESYAESGWLRAAETNDRYAWECEQDELRASGLVF
jgi:hypothetical protein